MGRRRSDRHRYGPRGEHLGHTSDDSPLAKLWYRALGLGVIGAIAWVFLQGCQ